MKLRIFFQKDGSEEVTAYLKEDGVFASRLRALCQEEAPVMGYKEGEILPVKAEEICCFIVEDGKVYALFKQERLALKRRLYQLEEDYGTFFIKINQSCLANTQRITRFDASFAGTLRVRFENGYTDYVSRRCLKKVKERFGL